MMTEATTEELMQAYEQLRSSYDKIRKQRNNAAKAYYSRNSKDILARIKAKRLAILKQAEN